MKFVKSLLSLTFIAGCSAFGMDQGFDTKLHKHLHKYVTSIKTVTTRGTQVPKKNTCDTYADTARLDKAYKLAQKASTPSSSAWLSRLMPQSPCEQLQQIVTQLPHENNAQNILVKALYDSACKQKTLQSKSQTAQTIANNPVTLARPKGRGFNEDIHRRIY